MTISMSSTNIWHSLPLPVHSRSAWTRPACMLSPAALTRVCQCTSWTPGNAWPACWDIQVSLYLGLNFHFVCWVTLTSPYPYRTLWDRCGVWLWAAAWTLPLPRVIDLKFSCSLTSNITQHSMKNLAFHSFLRWKMIVLPILTTSCIHLSLRRLGECTFWTWEWKG